MISAGYVGSNVLLFFRARSWNFGSCGSTRHHFQLRLLLGVVSPRSWGYYTFKFLKLPECLRLLKPKPDDVVPFTKTFRTSIVSVLKLPYSPFFLSPAPIPPPWPATYTLPNSAKHFASVQGWMHIHRKQNREILSKMQTHKTLLDSDRQVQSLRFRWPSSFAARDGGVLMRLLSKPR